MTKNELLYNALRTAFPVLTDRYEDLDESVREGFREVMRNYETQTRSLLSEEVAQLVAKVRTGMDHDAFWLAVDSGVSPADVLRADALSLCDVVEAQARSLASANECLEAIDKAHRSTAQRLANAKWPKHLGGPGERVLMLAAQGFDGVGRHLAAEYAATAAQFCKSDADAIKVLRAYQPNELEDLPFPIRDLFGIDESGNWLEQVEQ